MNKVLYSLLGGLFLVVLIAQNLVYLGMPVRISAWLLLGAIFVQAWLCRRSLLRWIRAFLADAELRTLTVVVFLTIAFHGIVPIRQGLEWYYGKGHFDQINYVLLAEFLRDEPYGTSEKDIGLRPWLVGPVGFHETTGQLGADSGAGLRMIGLKNERIGQSIITAEIGAWSGTDGKGGYAATVIFFLTVLAGCLYVFLRETGIDRFMAGSGALLGALLPAVTQLSLDGFLSQIAILFVFPFFASLLRQEDLSARSFTLFFSLTLAYVFAAYSEIAPIGLCILFLSVIFVRRDNFRSKRLMIMSAILLIVLVNPYYLRNLIGFLGYQYNLVANAPSLWDNVAPNILTLRGWSQLIFGPITSAPLVLLFDICALLVGLLFLAGLIFLPGRDKLIMGVILAPVVIVILYFASRTPFSYYPIAKITLTIVSLLIGLVFVVFSRLAARNKDRPIGLLMNLFCAFIVAAAAVGSARYYSAVLNNEGLLSIFREPRFLDVCRDLETMKNKRVLVFETHPLLSAWLCYHARHNDVYFDGRLISDSSVSTSLSFAKVPDLKGVDFVATRDRIVDLNAPSVPCLVSVDDTPGENRHDGHLRYRLGPPARLRFLALRSMSATLNLQLIPGPAAGASPVDYFLTDVDGHVFQGEIQGKSLEDLRLNLPRGLSYLELSVQAKESEPDAGRSFPILAELDGVQISDSK